MFPIQAEAEAFYRFIESAYVTPESLMAPHIRATLERSKCSDLVFIVHDSTKFVFSGQREGLHSSQSSAITSFWGHCSMAVEARSGHPLGVLRMHTWSRPKLTRKQAQKAGLPKEEISKIPSESERWLEGAEKTGALFEEDADVIHVCDSEGDCYDLLSGLTKKNHRFVIRGCQDRKINDESYENLKAKLAHSALIAGRSVKISRRLKATSSTTKRNVAREERVGRLGISAARVTFIKPKTASATAPKPLTVQAVLVKEIEPPAGCDPVEWILLTSEPISSPEEIFRVVDIYRNRWVIEEYFKVLKTGCAYETRQLESYDTLLKCLCIFVPVAWLMLRMREISRQDEQVPVEAALPSDFIEVLRDHSNKKLKTAKEAVLAIASMGGHMKHNGLPGWQIIWRGFRKLAILVEGYMLAKKRFLVVKKKM